MKFSNYPGKSWITPLLVVTIVVVSMPIIPTSIHVIGSVILSIIALASCKLIYLFYANLPAPKETILVHLMKFLMINASVVIVHAVTFGILFNLFPQVIQWGLDSFPNLTCSITVNEMYTVLMSYCFLAILVFKALAVFYPAYYLSMNHVKMWKWTSITISVLWFLEYLLILSSYKTLCTKHNKYNMITFRNLSVNSSDTNMNEKPPTFIFHSAAIVVLRMLISLAVLYKKRSVVKIFYKIHPSNKRIAPLRRIAVLKERNYEINDQRSSDNNRKNTDDSSKDKYRIDADIDVAEVLSELNINVESLPKPILVKEFDSSDSVVLDIDLVQALTECNTYEVSKESGDEAPKLKDLLNKDKSEHCTLNLTNNHIIERDPKDLNNPEETADPNKIKIIINTNAQDGLNHNLTKNIAESLTNNQNFRQLLLNTDIAIWIGTLGLVLAIFTVFINSHNKSVIIIHLIIGKVFFLALPPYWILRSEDKTMFALRRFKRLFNWHSDYCL